MSANIIYIYIYVYVCIHIYIYIYMCVCICPLCEPGAVPKFRREKLAVVLYTVARVIANLTVGFLIFRREFSAGHGDTLDAIIAMICDGLVRLVVTGMGVSRFLSSTLLPFFLSASLIQTE